MSNLKSAYFQQKRVYKKLLLHITDNRKLYLHTSFNTIFKFESYLDYIQDFTARYTLAKLWSVLITSKLKQDDLVKTKLLDASIFACTAKP